MNKVLESIPIVIRNQHTLLNLIAEGYRSIEKVLMEYVDNSFDSAEDFFDDDKYKRDVVIAITIDRKSDIIRIEDNCEGMDIAKMRGLANKVNESEKARRAQKRAWVTGKFGLGAHAYRFVAQDLQVVSQCKGAKKVAISIDRDSPHANLISPPSIDFAPSGTLVELRDVEKIKVKHLDPLVLKKEIETYFEGFLHRNVKIAVVDNETVYICEPFNYTKLMGVEINKVITSWNVGRMKVVEPLEKGVIVRLKVCSEKINRPPYFARKGRRINFIPQLDSFISKTEHRKKVWGHHLLTGFIEVQDNLDPVLTRDDFEGGKGKQQKRTGIYNEIVKLEDEIYAAIEIINKNKSDESFRNLASRLTDILSELVKEEELNLKYQHSGDKSKGAAIEKITLNSESTEEYKVEKSGGGGEEPSLEKHKEIVRAVRNPKSQIEGERIERQKQGIKIEFSPLPSEERTHFGDGVITIFTNHKDFQDRKGDTQQAELGSMKITARLANYLAAVISSEFKEVFYQQKKLEPSRTDILNQQVDFIFKMEDRMKDFIDRPLQSIGAIK